METISSLVALCGAGEFPSQKPVTQSLGPFFDMRLNKRLCKQSKRQWIEMPLRSLLRHCNEEWNSRLWEMEVQST